jgi:hypothetical protein
MVRVGCSAHYSARPDRVFPALGSRTVGIGRPYITGRLKCGVTRSHLTTESGQASQYPLAIRERPRVVSGLQCGATLYPLQSLERDIPFR